MEFEKFEVGKKDIETEEVEWPVQCRNCQKIYPKELKGMVSKRVCENVDFLKAVSTSFLEIGIARYCCINNYRPRVIQKNSCALVSEYFVEIRSRVFIDKTMTDWLDIRWEDDDIEEEFVEEVTKPNIENTVSLFDL